MIIPEVLYKRSVMFEIQTPEGIMLDSFCFTIPPTSLEIIQSQRITKTETPGGNFVDNYGLGNARISISGDTGNDEDRLTILGAGKTPRSISGKDAWYEFRNRIQRASLREENYIMKFYDLTNKGYNNIFNTTKDLLNSNSEAWEVVLEESGVKRSSSKPFFYPYSVSMTGIRPLGVLDTGNLRNNIKFISNALDSVTAAYAAIDKARDDLDNFLSTGYEYIDQVTQIFATLDAISGELATFNESFGEFILKVSGLGSEVLSSTENIINSGIQLITYPSDVIQNVYETGETLVSQYNSLSDTVKTAGDNILNAYDFEETVPPIYAIGESIREITENVNDLVITGRQSASTEPIGAIAINGVTTAIYGYKQTTVTAETTLENIARDELGDADLKDIISAVNGVYADNELETGQKLDIPVLTPSTRLANNAVYNIPEENDPLGRDAKVTDGKIVFTTQDYDLTTGDETITQAMKFRLDEKRGRQVKDNLYGITAQIGTALNNEAPFEYFATSLKETLVQDPRILDIYQLNLTGVKDKLYTTFKSDIITKETVTFNEGIQ